MDTQPKQNPVRFDLSFTPAIDTYIESCTSSKEKPTVKGFAKQLGCDVHDLWAWANKKKKDDKGQLTDVLARPNFHAALTRLHELEKNEEGEKLTLQQELFCKLYASDREFFGNGVQSYIEAYGIDTSKPGAYNVAKAGAYENLTKPYLLKRIDELLELQSLNDQAVDKELAFVIMQKADLSAKTAAIREYNKLRARITEKIDHTTKGKEFPTPIYGSQSRKTV
jgi:hypothetical protein